MFKKLSLTIRSHYDWQFWYVLFAAIAGAYAFFLNPSILESYREEWLSDYFDFSRSIYQSQKSYFAESLLLPWAALLLGASKHWLFYKLFGSFLNLLVLPVIAYAAAKYFNHAVKSWIFILVFLFTYRYLAETYYLGFPDPVTIMLLAGAAFQRKPILLFILVVLAAISHFSMTVVAIGALTMLVVTSPNFTKQYKITFIKYAVAALVLGKLLLTIWFYRFKYIPYSRLDWAIDYGLTSFVSRYQADISGFWLTPGIPFLCTFGLFVCIAILRRQVLFALAMLLALTGGYLALFFTIDGLRVFAVVTSAAYIFILKETIEQVFESFTAKRHGASSA